MAKMTWKNVRLFTGAADLTTVNNKVELTASVDTQETTAFVASGDVWTERLGGLRSTEISAEGQWEAGDTSKVDDSAFADLGVITPWTVCPVGAADGGLAYFTGALRTGYDLGGSIGDVAPWSAEGRGNWPLVRGAVMATPAARTSSSSGTAVQLGAVPSGKSLYAALHVMSVSGTTPSITARLQSDNASGFPSSTDQMTFTAQTATGSQIIRVAGPITDDWYRASWTITGTSPSFLFLFVAGIA